MLTILYCLLPISAIMMYHHLTLTDTLQKMDTGSFGSSSASICIQSQQGTEQVVKKLIEGMEQTKTEYAISLNVSLLDNGTVHYLYFNKEYANLPMKKGRFFIPSDFQKGNAVAVVGKEREKEVYKKNKNLYIRENEKEYRVIGIIGYEEETVLDNDIYINLLDAGTQEQNIYLLDYMTRNDAENRTKQCMDYLKKNNIHAEEMSANEEFAENLLPQILTVRWFLLMLGCYFLAVLLTSVQWVNEKKKTVAIQRLLGASKIHIVRLILKKYVLLAIFSLGVALFYCHICYPAYERFLWKGYRVALIFIVMFCFWSFYKLWKEPIPEAIK